MHQADELWKVTNHKKVDLQNTVFIEGLPGIGNVGKVVVDYLIEKSKATLVTSFFSYTLPNSVFVNEDNLVELPKIEVYHAKIAKKDFLFMTGDVQPTDEVSSYLFCEVILKQIRKEWGVKHIITLGGIGLQEAPNTPRVYCTGNNKKFLEKIVQNGADKEVYGVVGPIIGVSGLLLGLSQKYKIPAVALLAETLGHPMYLGLRGAKATLMLLKKIYDFTISFDDLDVEIEQIEKQSDDQDSKKNPKIDAINKLKRYRDTNYIG